MVSQGLSPSKTKTCNFLPVLTGIRSEPGVLCLPCKCSVSELHPRTSRSLLWPRKNSFRAGFLGDEQVYLQFSTEFKTNHRVCDWAQVKPPFHHNPRCSGFALLCVEVVAWAWTSSRMLKNAKKHRAIPASSYLPWLIITLRKKENATASKSTAKHWDRDQWDGWVGIEACCQAWCTSDPWNTWWMDRTDSHRLSSDLPLCAALHMWAHT